MDKHMIKISRESITSFEELMQYSTHVIEKNLHATDTAKLVLLQIDVNYHKAVSNSHCSPINGETNWGPTYKERPYSYPGWTGRVWVFYSQSTTDFESSHLSNCLIHPGTGGAGLYDIGYPVHEFLDHPADLPNNRADRWAYKGQSIYPISYDCKIFLDDLPGMKAHALLEGTTVTQHYKGAYEGNNSRAILGRGDKLHRTQISRSKKKV